MTIKSIFKKGLSEFLKVDDSLNNFLVVSLKKCAGRFLYKKLMG